MKGMNLCFTNSVTTALLNMPRFKMVLMEEDHLFSNENLIFKEIKTIMGKTNMNKASTKHLRSLVNFDDNNQHDTAEFLMAILNNLFGRFPTNGILKEQIFGGLCRKTMFCQCNAAENIQAEHMPEVLPIEVKGYSLESYL